MVNLFGKSFDADGDQILASPCKEREDERESIFDYFDDWSVAIFCCSVFAGEK